MGGIHGGLFSSVSVGSYDLGSFEIVHAGCCCIVFDDEFVVGGSQGAVEET